MPNATVRADARAMPIDRRAVFGAIAVAGAAALIAPAATLAATSAPVDPIFAAIDRHRAAEIACHCTIDAQDKVYARQHGREVTQADVDAYEAASAALYEAREAMINTPVTTMSGLRALLEYAAKLDDGCIPELGGELAPALLKSPLFRGEA